MIRPQRLTVVCAALLASTSLAVITTGPWQEVGNRLPQVPLADHSRGEQRGLLLVSGDTSLTGHRHDDRSERLSRSACPALSNQRPTVGCRAAS